MNKRLTIASFLLAVITVLPIISAFLMLFSGSSEFTYEELLGMTADQIEEFSPKLMKDIGLVVQLRGLYLLAFALLWLVISLIPFRKGEKWAWFTLLFVGSIWMPGYLVFTSIGVNEGIYLSSWITPGVIWLIMWIVGLALPIKEIFKKQLIDL